MRAACQVAAAMLMLASLLGAAPATQPTPRGPVLKTAHGEVEVFPTDNPWNRDISTLPVHPRSAAWIASAKPAGLHPDFGTAYGIPFVVVGKGQQPLPVSFQYKDESDAGPYPIPSDAPIEGGEKSRGDRHILVIAPVEQKLYEVYAAYKDGPGWRCGSGAVFDLSSNKLRPRGWTSADAAGLPIFPGLVRYDEVEAGEIRHALRFTLARTQRGYILPATHFASSSSSPDLPPMGMRVRLRAGFDISPFPKPVQVILTCLKTYGMLLADNGSDWYITGAPDRRWDDDALGTLRRVKPSDLEVVDTGEVITR